MAATSSRLRSRPKPQAPRDRPSRKRISYKEESTDSDEFVGTPSEDEYHTRSSRSRRHQSPSLASQSKPTVSRKRKAKELGHERPTNTVKKAKVSSGRHTVEEPGDPNIQFAGKTMPLQTLPYQILLSIFDYASRPLMSDAFQPTSSIPWLLRVALCCRAFAEPALSALYYSPPLAPPNRAHALRSLLMSHSEIPTFNYGAKIKYLDVEASSTLLHKYGGLDPINLGQFATYTPQLRGIGIHLLSDNPKYRKDANWSRPGGPLVSKDIYGQSLLSSLQSTNIILHEWTWNQSLSKERDSLATLGHVHRMAPFRNLRTISFVNYEAGQAKKGKRREDLVAEALGELPQLKSVSFNMSSVVNDRLIPLLPDSLQALEIVDCAGVRSPAMKVFLALKGQDLRQLILDHNNALHLSFLTALAVSCPKLELLKMDLRYFNKFITVRDCDPRYDALFNEGDVPTWPTTLRTLELLHLRKWGLATAETFFMSLTKASEYLPDLRSLKIKASLDESGWRDRIGFRDKWTQRLQNIFLRRSAPPNPHLKSFAAFDAWNKQQSGSRNDEHHRKAAGISSLITRSALKGMSSLNVNQERDPQNTTKAEDSDSDAPLVKSRRHTEIISGSEAPSTKVRRSTRAKMVREDAYTLSESSTNGRQVLRRRRRRKGSNASSSEDSAIDDDGVETPDQPESQDQSDDRELYIQGMCDVVDVLIDNLRPTEETLNENDFLDEEASGDEDWNGDDDMPGEASYAW